MLRLRSMNLKSRARETDSKNKSSTQLRQVRPVENQSVRRKPEAESKSDNKSDVELSQMKARNERARTSIQYSTRYPVLYLTLCLSGASAKTKRTKKTTKAKKGKGDN